MKRSTIVVALLFAYLGCAPTVFADDLIVRSGDTIPKLLIDFRGKVLTVRLNSGEEMTGRVRVVTGELVQLGELSNQEFFDAILDISQISAIIVRVK